MHEADLSKRDLLVIQIDGIHIREDLARLSESMARETCISPGMMSALISGSRLSPADVALAIVLSQASLGASARGGFPPSGER